MSDNPIVAAVKNFLEVEAEIHKMYPTTATCRSGPGVVAGQAFTKHCVTICSNPEHHSLRNDYHEALNRLWDLVEEEEEDSA